MRRDRKSAELLAGSIALRAGRDPFESALSAGIADATHGRLFADSRPAGEHNRRSYALGFELGRFALLDFAGATVPDAAACAAILTEKESTICERS